MRHRKFQWLAGAAMMLLPLLVLSAWQDADLGGGASSGGKKSAAAAAKRPAAQQAARKPIAYDIGPETNVYDPYPTFNGIAVDPDNNVVFMSDLNRHGYLLYDRMANSEHGEVTQPLRHVFGPKTGMGFVAGVQLDPSKKELYIAENDGWCLRTFSYRTKGNA